MVSPSRRYDDGAATVTDVIVPICTVEELAAEGRAQDNCVATYAERVQSRRTFIYRVLKPERATLSILRGSDGDWQISQLERGGNRRPDLCVR